MRIPGIAIVVGLALAAAGGPAAGGEGLPERASDVLFVGDSVTAGMYFYAHGDAYAEQGWAGQLMRSLGMAPDRPRLEDPYPLDMLELTREGFGVAGWRYPWNALPALRGRGPKFDAGEPRSIVAVPGQTLTEVFEQSSENPGKASTGWVLGAFLLPRGMTAIETAERSSDSPRWIVLFVGGNDALAHFGIVGSARPPEPPAFAARYRALASRLRALLAPGVAPSHLLVGTLPDVTALPMLQPVPPGAVDEKRRALPAGTKTSAFLLRFRGDRFHTDEVWTSENLARVRERVGAYSDAIRAIAADEGYTVVDIEGFTDELAADRAFSTPNSPYFSPDLHHPSTSTHRRVAELVLRTMAEVAGVPPPQVGPPATMFPTNADFSPEERARVDTFMRLAILSGEDGHFPPLPTWRFGFEAAKGAGNERFGDGSIAVALQIESSPGPITNGWISRGAFGLRGVAAFTDGEEPELPEAAQDLRAAIAFEPVGRWNWQRAEAGLRCGWAGGLGWYARGEWRALFAEASGDPWVPRRLDVGLRLGGLRGRPGHNGN